MDIETLKLKRDILKSKLSQIPAVSAGEMRKVKIKLEEILSDTEKVIAELEKRP